MKSFVINILKVNFKRLFIFCVVLKKVSHNLNPFKLHRHNMMKGVCTDTKSEENTRWPQTYKIKIDAEILLNAFWQSIINLYKVENLCLNIYIAYLHINMSTILQNIFYIFQKPNKKEC